MDDGALPRHAQQMPEGVAAAVQCRGGADIQTLHGEVTAGEQLRRRVPLVRCDGAGRTCPGRQRRVVQYRCRPVQVQGPQLPVGAPALVVVDPEGGVGVLLDLGDEDAGADGVDGAWQDEERIALLHRHPVQHLADGAVLRPAAELLRRDLPGKAEVDGGALVAVHDVPHLGLPRLALLPQGRLIGGMHLDGQILPGVDELHQQRKVLHPRAVRAPEGVLVQRRQLVGGLPRQRAALHRGDALRPLGQLPALRRDVRRVRLVIVSAQAIPAPEIVLVARVQLQRCELHDPPAPFRCDIARIIPRPPPDDKAYLFPAGKRRTVGKIFVLSSRIREECML